MDSQLEYALQLARAGRDLPLGLAHHAQAVKEIIAREENRRRYPETAALFDRVKELFPQAEVLGTDERAVTPPEAPATS